MKVYFVRHGQTEENISNTLQGHQPGRLTETGREQARRLGERLSGVVFDAIYASDLGRVVDTTGYILHERTGSEVPVSYDWRLRERGVGIYEGRQREVLQEAELSTPLPRVEFRPEGGESFLDLLARVESFMAGLRERHADGQTILLVSHGGWNRVLISLAEGMSLDDSLELSQRNTCVNVLEWVGGQGYRLLLRDCIDHLASAD